MSQAFGDSVATAPSKMNVYWNVGQNETLDRTVDVTVDAKITDFACELIGMWSAETR